jgi:glycosyltransferase involved in cell wall biosynthesis
MKFVLVADTFPPLRNSGAIQLRDLSREFVRQGHSLTVLLPSAGSTFHWSLSEFEGVQVVRLKAPNTKDVGYVRRTLAELIMPFAMLRGLRRSPLAEVQWDGVLWYSPSIFHGPLIAALKKRSKKKSYLIVRDIFPEWAVDMGLMSRHLPYLFFKAIANYQYSVADCIGVQTSGNLKYFKRWVRPNRELQVLPNWLGEPSVRRCSIRIDNTTLAGRKILVYAGNMGVAQGMDTILGLAKSFSEDRSVGFLFVGRGSEVQRLREEAIKASLENVAFFDEIDPDEIPDLYAQCRVGIVALDARHRSHNIPGKFLTYMQCGLPVLANINAGNDLAEVVRCEGVGRVCETNSVEVLSQLTEELLDKIETDDQISTRCRELFDREFSVDRTVRQIVSALTS